ncbi:hypothetical protein ACFO0N_16925 [Halobium salinum]|uniref:Uncharacterized protein n=1 Tax=Halobium salinum TaxID=1364940 RepID=A0ABD5PGH8_9EURY|nr:hypothetical protein [Halobium salinum]
MVVLQAGAAPLAVVGTVALFALFLSLTAHLAARNVLGDVAVRKALLVGPLPAVVAVVTATFSLPAVLGVALALALDALAIRYVYGRSPRLTAYVTFIHVVVTVILGAMLFALLALFASAPG